MAPISLFGSPRTMGLHMGDVPAFPGGAFNASIPEAIGDAARTYWFGTVKADWRRSSDGVLEAFGSQDGESEYTARVTSTEDTVDIRIALTNRSQRTWENSLAFNCFSPIGVRDVRDHECLRHWVGMKGRAVELKKVPRKFGPRPAIQLYPVEGGPAWKDIGFVANFQCSPDNAVLEPWMAIVARDKGRLIAVVSKPGLFLFQNREYSCIHSGPGFGRLAPGETGHGITRIYLVNQTLDAWYARMSGEMSQISIGG